MKAIILAAGYATRLYPLTKDKAKALLPIGEKTILDYIMEKLEALPEIDTVYVVSNAKFAGQFEQWKAQSHYEKEIVVLNDGTCTEKDRRGAIGDIWFTVQEGAIDDEIMVIAGDNFFTYSLRDYLNFYYKKGSDCVCVKQWENKEELSRFGIAVLDEENRVLDIEEKPANPKSDTVVFAAYIYGKDTVPLIGAYLEEGNKPDAPGNFPAWLYKRKDVYAFRFDGDCYDIGTPESYHEICRLMAEGAFTAEH